MYIVAIAWMFVVLLMAAAEATSTQGSLLGALITLVLYGLMPLSIVLYIMGTPVRRKARQAQEMQEHGHAQFVQQSGNAVPASDSTAPDGRSVPARDLIAPEREKP